MADDTFISRRLRPRRLKGRAGPNAPAPFVVGVGRSGTTLLRLMLDAGSEVAMPPETHFFQSVLDASGRVRFTPRTVLDAIVEDEHRRWNDFGLEPEELRARFDAIPRFNISDALRAFYELYAERQGKERWGDKTPDYIKRMRRIKRVLPEARFIHVIRDGRDVALSMAESFERAPQTAVEAALFWRTAVESGRRDGSALGADRYLEVRYEELMADPNPALEGVCRFLGLEMEAAMLSPASAVDRVLAGYPDHSVHRNLGLPVEMRRDWRNEMPEDEIARFEILAGDVLSGLSYEVSAPALNGPELERRRLELVASEVVGLRRALFAANRRGGAAAP